MTHNQLPPQHDQPGETAPGTAELTPTGAVTAQLETYLEGLDPSVPQTVTRYAHGRKKAFITFTTDPETGDYAIEAQTPAPAFSLGGDPTSHTSGMSFTARLSTEGTLRMLTLNGNKVADAVQPPEGESDEDTAGLIMGYLEGSTAKPSKARALGYFAVSKVRGY
jgi:hypothetical protein